MALLGFLGCQHGAGVGIYPLDLHSDSVGCALLTPSLHIAVECSPWVALSSFGASKRTASCGDSEKAPLRFPAGGRVIDWWPLLLLSGSPTEVVLKPHFLWTAPSWWLRVGRHTGPFLRQPRLFPQATLLQGVPVSLAKPFWEQCCCMRPFLPNQPSFLLSCTGVRPALQLVSKSD